MNAIIVFGPNYVSVTAALGRNLQKQGGGRLDCGQSANELKIADGTYSPCTLIYAHYSLTGSDFESSAKKILGGMHISLESINNPKLDWYCDKSSNEVSLTMHWNSCNATTLRKVVSALESSYVSNAGRITKATKRDDINELDAQNGSLNNRTPIPKATWKTCPQCGAGRDIDAIECNKCGMIYSKYRPELTKAKDHSNTYKGRSLSSSHTDDNENATEGMPLSAGACIAAAFGLLFSLNAYYRTNRHIGSGLSELFVSPFGKVLGYGSFIMLIVAVIGVKGFGRKLLTIGISIAVISFFVVMVRR